MHQDYPQMSTMYITSEHIQQWIRTGKAKVIPVAIAEQLGEYLDRLPWLPDGNGLDSNQLEGSRVALPTLTDSEQPNWINSSSMSEDPFLVFWYVRSQPCIACDMEFVISNIDQAFWKAPGNRYVFGALGRH